MSVDPRPDVRSASGSLRSLSSQIVVYGLGSVAGSAVPLVLVPLYTRYLSQGEYGALELLVITVSVLSTILQMGTGPAVFRSLKPDAPPGARDGAMSAALGAVMVVGVSAVGATVLVRQQLTDVLLGGGFPAFLIVAASVQAAAQALSAIPLSLLRMEERARLYSILNAGRALFAIALLVPLILVFGLEGVVVGLAVESVAFVLVALGVVRSRWRWRWSPEELSSLLRFGVPLVGTGFGLMIIGTADRYLLRSFATLEAVGIYALGYRIASTLGMLGRAFQTAWAAVVFSKDHGPEALAFFARVAKYVLVTLSFAGMAVSVFSADIIGIVAPDSWVSGTEALVPILCLGFVMRGLFTATAVGVNLRDRTEGTTVAANLAAAVQIVLGIFLVREWGPLGAAWATAAAMTTLAAVGTAISLRLMWIPYEWGKMAFALGGAIGYVYLGNILESLLSPGPSSVGVRLALVLSFPVLLIVTGTIDSEDFLSSRGGPP